MVKSNVRKFFAISAPLNHVLIIKTYLAIHFLIPKQYNVSLAYVYVIYTIFLPLDEI